VKTSRSIVALTLLPLLFGTACIRSCGRAPGSSLDPDAAPAEASADSTLLGGERGLDHVGIAVKDLDATTHIYHDLLGFNRPTEGKLPNGIRNVNYYFADSTYLETLVYWDRTKAEWLASFTDKHSGALFAVLSAFSPEDTAEYLSRRGIQMGATFSGTIQTAGEDAMPEEKWKTFFLPEGALPGDPLSLYFIAYKRGPREEFLQKLQDPKARRLFFHKNTAVGLRAVWFAVPDLAAASKAYAAIGLPPRRPFTDDALGADGQIFAAGLGEIRLLAPRTPDGLVAQFLHERGGPGIIGVTLAAGNVHTAATVIAEGTGVPMPSYDGLLGNSIRVGPDITQGVWIELSQQ
jgi:catechol 2,3-dioxygenase-like lactoylglutathione lyase family enzyme